MNAATEVNVRQLKARQPKLIDITKQRQLLLSH